MAVLLDTCGWRMVKSLLLLYVFVVRAAADCPRPQGKENIVLTNESLLKNDFPEGSQATLECANGYDIESGSGTVTCTDGQWTEPDLNCKKKDCGIPKQLPNMYFEYTTDGTLFGAKVRVHCDIGYYLQGTSYKQCFANGWTGRGKCEVETCTKPGDVANGRHSWVKATDPIYTDVIEYFCDDGYTLTGNHVIECGEEGQYNSLPPECKEDTITTTRGTSTPPPPGRGGEDIMTTVDSSLMTEASTTTVASPITHRDEVITTSAASAASPPIQGGRNILEGRTTTTRETSTAPPPSQGEQGEVDRKKGVGLTTVISSVIITAIVVTAAVFALYCFLVKRKGSAARGTVHVC